MDDLRHVEATWDSYAREDALWSILTAPGKEGGQWDLDEFYDTGEAEVVAIIELLERLGLSPETARALDFGCGVGRLTRAMGSRFDWVVGVDVSAEMIARAQRLNGGRTNLTWIHNPHPGLPDIEDRSIDFIYTRLVLQHMPTAAALGYLSEFARVLAPRGLLVFQYPCGNIETQARPGPIRRVLRRLRAFLRPAPPRPLIMEMHGHPVSGVVDQVQRSGLRLHAILDDSGSAPPDDAYMYIAGRPDRRTTAMPFLRP